MLVLNTHVEVRENIVEFSLHSIPRTVSRFNNIVLCLPVMLSLWVYPVMFLFILANGHVTFRGLLCWFLIEMLSVILSFEIWKRFWKTKHQFFTKRSGSFSLNSTINKYQDSPRPIRTLHAVVGSALSGLPSRRWPSLHVRPIRTLHVPSCTTSTSWC